MTGSPAVDAQRDDPGPHAAGLDVDVLVGGVAGAALDRRLVQRQRQHRRRGELLAGRPAQVRGPARGDVVDEQVEGVRPLGLVGHRPAGRPITTAER